MIQYNTTTTATTTTTTTNITQQLQLSLVPLSGQINQLQKFSKTRATSTLQLE